MRSDNRQPAVRILTSEASDAAKQAARDAVAGYERLNPYTIGVAVEAALAVVTGPAMMVHTSVTSPTATTQMGPVVDARVRDVTQRSRLLEAVVSEIRREHQHGSMRTGCALCRALDQLDATG